MKRSLALLTSGALLAMPFAADAAPKAPKKTKRTITYDYTGAAAFSIATGLGGSLEGITCDLPRCWDFDTLKGEKTITITAKDASGTPTGLQVFTDDDYNGAVFFCGSTTLKISPKSAHSVSVRTAFSAECQALPTEGTLTAVITNY